MGRSLFRREVLLPLLAVLVLTAPLSTPTYSACMLLANHLATFPAHMAFRLYLQESDSRQPTVVNSLMNLLSLLVHLGESNAVGVLVLRMVFEKSSLSWYQENPGLACFFMFPRSKFILL